VVGEGGCGLRKKSRPLLECKTIGFARR